MHVRVETRKVYVSARGPKLTRHAAYVAAAKKMIADRCARWNDERALSEWCNRHGAHRCRLHARSEKLAPDGEPIEAGMLYYVRVKSRLVRFLKFVDRRQAERTRGGRV